MKINSLVSKSRRKATGFSFVHKTKDKCLFRIASLNYLNGIAKVCACNRVVVEDLRSSMPPTEHSLNESGTEQRGLIPPLGVELKEKEESEK